MSDEASIEEELRAGIERVVREHEASARLGGFVFDVLSSQASARSVFSGAAFVERKAEQRELTEAIAETELGNVLTVLSRGPESDSEFALVSAFYVRGLADALSVPPENDPSDSEASVARFVEHADWFDEASGYRMYPWISDFLSESASKQVETERDARARRTNEVELDSSKPASPELRGLWSSRRLGRWRILSYVTGFALLGWLVQGIARLAGVRRDALASLVPGGVEINRTTSLLGRPVRSSREFLRDASIETVSRGERFPMIGTLVGLVALCVGVLLGGLFVFDGVRSGETVLLLIGAVLVFVGAGLDFALEVLLPGRSEQVRVEFRLASSRTLCLSHVDRQHADRFLEEIEGRNR